SYNVIENDKVECCQIVAIAVLWQNAVPLLDNSGRNDRLLPFHNGLPSAIDDNTEMSTIARRGIHFMQRLNSANVSSALLEKGQNRVIDASLTLIRERAKLKASRYLYELEIASSQGELVRALGGAKATSSLLGVPLGHNSSFLQGPAFAPPRIREAIWCGSTNSTTEEGKDLQDARVLTDVGDVPIQEIRDCGVDDHRLMNVISESVKLVMEEDPLRPLVLGGDHSISFPVIRAVSEKLGGPVDVLHLDAHPDNYDAFEGNIYSHASSFARVMEGDYVRRLLQVGIRSITTEGRAQAKKFGVEQYEMRTFSRDRHFLENLKLGEGVKGVYISIDVDCLDPAFAPGVSHIEPGGLSFRDVLNILHNLQGEVVAGDVVEFNPQRDTVDGMTAMVAAKLVRELAAKIAK
ncbi:arginase-like protein, partial [Trifolium pratense]